MKVLIAGLLCSVFVFPALRTERIDSLRAKEQRLTEKGRAMVTNDLLTAKEAADILRVKPDFVRDLVRRGELHGYAIGGPKKRRIVVPRGSLNAYLQACEIGSSGIVPLKPPKPLSVAGHPLLKKYGSKR